MLIHMHVLVCVHTHTHTQEIYFKVLAHVIMEAKKLHHLLCAAGDPRRLVVQVKGLIA